jgi:hypothetical protein
MKVVSRLIKIALILLAIICVAFFVRQAVAVFARISLTDALERPGAIVAAFALALAWIASMALFWDWAIRRVFKSQGIDLVDTFSAFTRSYVARYVPGKIWIIATRIEPLKRKGVPSGLVVSASAFEQLSIAAGAIVPALAVLLAFLNSAAFARISVQINAWLAAALAAVAVLVIVATIAALAAGPVRAWLSARLKGAEAWIPRVTPQSLALGLVGGIAISLLQALNVLPLLPWPETGSLSVVDIASVCLAYPTARVIGQVGSFAPAGLGVREGAFVLLTTSFIGADAAVVIAVWMRAIAIAAEALMFAAGAAAQWRFGKPPVETAAGGG